MAEPRFCIKISPFSKLRFFNINAEQDLLIEQMLGRETDLGITVMMLN